MSNVGEVSGINGTSMNLNGQAGQGAMKPSPSAGSANPGGHKPPRLAAAPVPLSGKSKR